MYAIVDIEATGVHESQEIIEIAIIHWDGEKVVSVYETLIKPDGQLLPHIIELTKITPKMLQNAPRFDEVSDKIYDLLENTTLISHKTDFDYEILKKSFSKLGKNLKLKTICTLKLSYQHIPGLKSYSLDTLCSFFRIKIQDRHRAIGDALATLELFKELENFMMPQKSSPRFHAEHERMIKKSQSKPGYVVFYDKSNHPLSWIVTHSVSDCLKEKLEIKNENSTYLNQTHEIKTSYTGSKLIAEFEVSHLKPLFFKYEILLEKSKSGYLRPVLSRYNYKNHSIWLFLTKQKALEKLKKIQSLNSDKKLSAHEYNYLIQKLQKQDDFPSPHLLIWGFGRQQDEYSYVLVVNGQVQGYCYSDINPEQVLLDPYQLKYQRMLSQERSNYITRQYLKDLKNDRHKTDQWKEIREKKVTKNYDLNL